MSPATEAAIQSMAQDISLLTWVVVVYTFYRGICLITDKELSK